MAIAIECPECGQEGTPPGLRRHRSAKHGYPPRGELVDRYFDDHIRGTAAEILGWLEECFPHDNWPYERWTQSSVSRDLAQHNNYPRRWLIVCEHHGASSIWQRIGPAPSSEEDITAEQRLTLVRELLSQAQGELLSLGSLIGTRETEAPKTTM